MESEITEGHYHPLSSIIQDICAIFHEMGFNVAEGPEMETEYYNFDALNIPHNHPARDMWDTFWIKPKKNGNLLRTHTSPVQIRYMENHAPPLAIVSPGKVFRYEATDATHEAQFHQVEGLMVGEDVSMATLKYVLNEFFRKFFGKEINVRFRPSYFPFVEPGVEVDVSCFQCDGKKCALCKHTGWIEIVGAGMVHREVLNKARIDFRKWRGFAFGIGVDRMAMLKYEIPDIRLFYNGDLRLINQF